MQGRKPGPLRRRQRRRQHGCLHFVVWRCMRTLPCSTLPHTDLNRRTKNTVVCSAAQRQSTARESLDT